MNERLIWNSDSLVNAIDLSRLSQLQVLTIDCLSLSKESSMHPLASALPSILERIESSCLDAVELRFQIETDVNNEHLASLDWSHLERVLLALHFFGLGQVRLVLDMGRSNRDRTSVEHTSLRKQIQDCLPELNRRGVLHLQYVEEDGEDRHIGYPGKEDWLEECALRAHEYFLCRMRLGETLKCKGYNCLSTEHNYAS